MNLSIKIARRLSLSVDNGQRKSLAVKVATISVALSIAVMLLTIAVTTGFRQAIKEKISGFEAQLTVTSLSTADEVDRYNFFANKIELTPQLLGVIRSVSEKAEINVSLSCEAMLKTLDNFAALRLKSYAPGYDTTFLKEMIEDGQPSMIDSLFSENPAQYIVISSDIASELGLKIGEKINTLFFEDGKIRLRNPEIVAIYNSHFSNYDRNIAFASKSMLDGITSTSLTEGNSLEIRGLDFENIDGSALNLQSALDRFCLSTPNVDGANKDFFRVTPVTVTAANYFSWLSLLDTNVVVMIVLMSLIALFTLVATLFILIIERTSVIGILKTLGARNRLVRGIFISLIGRIALRGMIWGNAIALLIILLQSLTHLLPLDPESYFLNYVPMSISPLSIIALNLSAIAVIIIAMLLPSAIISRISPASTIRYE